MKKLAIYFLCAITVLSLTACGARNDSMNDTSSAAISNPFIDCKTLDEAIELTGFDISLPQNISVDFTERSIRAIKDNMIEVIYKNSDGKNQIRIRKAISSEDISGDFNEYAENNTVNVDSLSVMMKGADGKVSTATWTNDQYAYAISASNGISSAEMVELIQAVE